MAWSVVARDCSTGQYGVIVASRFLAAGALIARASASSAAATQGLTNPYWAIEGVRRTAGGEAAEDVLESLIARDGGRNRRQCHLIDAEGRTAAFTGQDCPDWAGDAAETGVSVAGNALAGAAVVAETLTAYLYAEDLPFAERLIHAMEAGEAAGGDRRGRQSAALLIHRGEDYPWLDLRVDDHGDPLAELRRLYEVAGEQYLYIADTLPTRENFSGGTDRSAIEAAIRVDTRRREEEGRVSRSLARDPGSKAGD